MPTHPLNDAEYSRYRALLSGLTPDNEAEVRSKLREMGVLGTGSGSNAEAVTTQDIGERPLKRVRAEAAPGTSGSAGNSALV